MHPISSFSHEYVILELLILISWLANSQFSFMTHFYKGRGVGSEEWFIKGNDKTLEGYDYVVH